MLAVVYAFYASGMRKCVDMRQNSALLCGDRGQSYGRATYLKIVCAVRSRALGSPIRCRGYIGATITLTLIHT